MELTLARHAQPHWEPDGKAVDDPDLTEYGRRQAVRLADRLEPLHFDHFLVSPTRRSRQTAAPLEERWGRPARVLDWLEEIRTPKLEGTPEDAVRTFLAEARNRPLDDWWNGLPGGEAFRDFHARIVVGMATLLAELDVHALGLPHLWEHRAPAQKILIVSHGGTTSVLLSHLLGLVAVPWEWERFPLAWAAMAVLKSIPMAEGHLWSLQQFNLDSHLQGLQEDA